MKTSVSGASATAFSLSPEAAMAHTFTPEERAIASFYEKLVIVDGEVAFVGGIDMTDYAGDRYDSSDHPARRRLGWHDVGTRLRGPAVLDVHGGPQVRDVWGWNPEAQWLANRGYLCIQVNYRGSTGYGKSFVAAGDREWGAKMHDDLLDAVQYAVDQGWADPDRVAIYGGSYGGYAALVGAAFTPDVFRCAVDIVGPSNLQTLLETIPPYWAPVKAQLYKRVGNPETDQALGVAHELVSGLK